MSLVSSIRNFFLAKNLQENDDPFESVKYRVLLNFSLFLLFANIPYTFISWYSHPVHFTSALVQNAVMIFVIYCLRNGKHVRIAIGTFLVNFYLQNLLHFLINNGVILDQGVLFYTAICLMAFILMNSAWGWSTTLMVLIMTIVGIYNKNNDFNLFRFPSELADPTTEKEAEYMIILPFLMNIYLIGEYLKAQNQARKLLREQKKKVSEKNEEILESLRYARRIQSSLMPTTKYVARSLEKLRKN